MQFSLKHVPTVKIHASIQANQSREYSTFSFSTSFFHSNQILHSHTRRAPKFHTWTFPVFPSAPYNHEPNLFPLATLFLVCQLGHIFKCIQFHYLQRPAHLYVCYHERSSFSLSLTFQRIDFLAIFICTILQVTCPAVFNLFLLTRQSYYCSSDKFDIFTCFLVLHRSDRHQFK